jgi:predicted ester cyclase
VSTTSGGAVGSGGGVGSGGAVGSGDDAASAGGIEAVGVEGGVAAAGVVAAAIATAVEDNKALVRRIYTEGFNGGDEAIYSELYRPDFRHHSKTIHDIADAAEGERQSMLRFRRAIPDVHFELLEELGEGDRVMVRLRITGTLAEVFGTLTDVGAPVDIHAVALFRIEDGLAAEEWFFVDGGA